MKEEETHDLRLRQEVCKPVSESSPDLILLASPSQPPTCTAVWNKPLLPDPQSTVFCCSSPGRLSHQLSWLSALPCLATVP